MVKHSIFLTLSLFVGTSLPVQAAPQDGFGLRVLDAETGRGVPLVELKTVSDEVFVTDSNGFAAINEPALMNQKVYFAVKSHGYEVDADGFGYRGQAFQVKAGGRGEIKIKRLNLAERLYRITGAGIYRDSVLLGEKVPLANRVLNGGVVGQDTVMATPYKGKIYWFWGDTERLAYLLGNFATSGATSLVPQKGGLNPSVGVDLTYWTDENGFSKAMLPLPGSSGPVWVGGVFTLNENGTEQLFTQYARIENSSGKATEKGLALFNDSKAIFEKVLTFDGPLHPDGQPLRVWIKGAPYLYFQSTSTEAMPVVRVRADRAHVTNPKSYQAFTPLKTGSKESETASVWERDAKGKLVYAWKSNTAAPGFEDRKKAVASGQLKAEEVPFQLRDVESDAPIQSHGGSVHWNDFRRKWVMISGQAFGTSSYLGELWFAEADTPVGPWVYARKIVTHNKYTFYNPTQHPFFDQDGGRLIYFEGTYTTTYSGVETPTPRYDYNQIMYRLDLSDRRLALPSPVYRLQSKGKASYAMREDIKPEHRSQIQEAPFFAVVPARSHNGAHNGMIPIFQTAPGQLATKASAQGKPLFYALPVMPAKDEKPSPAVVPLYEYRDEKTGQLRYSTSTSSSSQTEKRAAQPLCRVWHNPSSTLALDFEAQPAP